MLSKLAYGIMGLAIVALSFSATLFALNRLSGSPSDASLFTGSILTASDNVRDTALADLPKSSAFEWFVVRGLNVKAASESAVVAGQPILRLVATPNSTGHSLVAHYGKLTKNQVYRITAWVRSEAGGNVEMEALDQPSGTPVNRCLVVVDLSNNKFLSTTSTKAQGVEPGPDNWHKVWVDLPTTDGEFLVAIRPAKGNSDTFSGDGRLGVTLGGIQMDPRHG
jgi:hypothetical protein